MTAVLQSLDSTREVVHRAMRVAVARLDPATRLVVSYHLGWCDENGRTVQRNGGKTVRAGMTLLATQALGAPREEGLPGAVAVELVHNFSLVHDDLMDHDRERRHRPTVWAVWDEPTAVLAGDAMLCLAQEVLLDGGSSRAVEASRLLTAATRELIRGQVQDLAFERRDEVSLDECLDMASGKTGALLAASAAVGAALAGARAEQIAGLRDYGMQVGLAFQLVDDLLGIWGRPETTGKPVFSDLRSRKKTLPVTWAIEQGGPDGQELADWMRRRTRPTEREVRRAAELVELAGGRAWAWNEARRRTMAAVRALAPLDLVDEHRQDLHTLAWFVADRDH